MELIVTSQEHRTQSQNRDDAMKKLEAMIAQARVVPKERVQKVGISENTKVERKVEKRQRSTVKSNRSKVSDY